MADGGSFLRGNVKRVERHAVIVLEDANSDKLCVVGMTA